MVFHFYGKKEVIDSFHSLRQSELMEFAATEILNENDKLLVNKEVQNLVFTVLSIVIDSFDDAFNNLGIEA